MKRAFIGFIVIVAILFIWDAVDFFMDSSLSPMARAKKSLLVVYSKPDTNGIFVVQEIWKDTRKSHSSLVGLKLSKFKGGLHVQSPDGAVSFYEKEFWFSRHLTERYSAFVNSGRIEDMSLEQYKKACGLNNASP